MILGQENNFFIDGQRQEERTRGREINWSASKVESYQKRTNDTLKKYEQRMSEVVNTHTDCANIF